MGHYGDLYDGAEASAARQKKLETAKTLANSLHEAISKLREVHGSLLAEGYHRLAWEHLQEIVDDLKSCAPLSRERAIAVTHLETAILWLRK